MTSRIRVSANGRAGRVDTCLASRRGGLACAGEIIPSNRKALLPIKLVVGVVGRLWVE